MLLVAYCISWQGVSQCGSSSSPDRCCHFGLPAAVPGCCRLLINLCIAVLPGLGQVPPAVARFPAPGHPAGYHCLKVFFKLGINCDIDSDLTLPLYPSQRPSDAESIELSNFISSASDRKKKNKIKQLYNTTQRNEKHRQTFIA